MCTISINHSDDFWNEDANDFLFAGDRSKGRFYPHLLQFHIFFPPMNFGLETEKIRILTFIMYLYNVQN